MFNGLLIGGWEESHISDAVSLHLGLVTFTSNQEFKILKEGPFPTILGMDFLLRSQMRVELHSKTYSFAFAPTCVGSSPPRDWITGSKHFCYPCAPRHLT